MSSNASNSRENAGQSLRITYLRVENFMRVKAVRLKPDKTLVKIEGKNGAGKSSVLNFIAAVLGGAKTSPEEPIHAGSKNAGGAIHIGLPGEPPKYIVHKRWGRRSNELLVTTHFGARIDSPQTFLREMINDLGFDPEAFSRMKPRQQGEELRRLAGLDFSDLDSEREQRYEERRTANAELKNLSTIFPQTPPEKPETEEPIEVSAMTAAYQASQEAAREVFEADRAIENLKRRIEELRVNIEALSIRLEDERLALSAASKARSEMKSVEIVDFSADISRAEDHNRKLETYRHWLEGRHRVKEAEEKAEALQDRIEQIDEEKTSRLKAAKFPLPGLSLDDDGLPLLNGFPIAQASSSERLRIGTAIALSEKRPLRVALLREGSLLDTASMEDLHRIMEEFDAQAFVEQVRESASPGGVLIEDGEIANGE